MALRAAGVPFDVLPGVTNAIAAPELAGIPFTHRGVASAVLVVTGHDERTFTTAVGQLTPNGLTLVVLMGLGRSAAIAGSLIDRGWSRGTPVAVVFDASTPRQHVWRGQLEDLASVPPVHDSEAPGTIVIGAVAAMDLFGMAGLQESVPQEETIHVSRR